MLVHRRVTPPPLSSMSSVPIYTPSWRETKWSKVPCQRKQLDGRGLNPGPPDPEFEVLTARPKYRAFSHDVTSYCCSKTIKHGDHVVVSNKSCGIKLFSYVSSFFCSNEFAQMLVTWMKTLCRYIEKGRRKILQIIHFPETGVNYSCITLRIPEGVNQKLGNGIQLRVVRSQTYPLYTAIFNTSCLLLCTMDYTPFRQ